MRNLAIVSEEIDQGLQIAEIPVSRYFVIYIFILVSILKYNG